MEEKYVCFILPFCLFRWKHCLYYQAYLVKKHIFLSIPVNSIELKNLIALFKVELDMQHF